MSIVVAYSIILYTFLLHRHFQFNGLDVQYLVVASPVHGDVPSLTTGNLSGQIIISTLNLNGLVFWYLGDSFYETTIIFGRILNQQFPQESMLNFLGLHILKENLGATWRIIPALGKWLVTMLSKSMKDPVVFSTPSKLAIPWLINGYKWGLGPNHLQVLGWYGWSFK